ncbi:MAG: hypothetical protein A2Y12_03930 [Planctomycetes bacterium GWF2_42_9]|nr:MAG: hypothetical protein A2Y12_03930 [Planctomycetes bacterium GWF2_42_9]HAL45050.1 hypothetical protein [Phycisphaerales bacterium]
MIWWIIAAIILIIICGILLAVEFFVPSFGLITVIAMCFLAGGIAIFFRIGPQAGWIGVITSAVLVPVVFFVFFKILPHTNMGKSLTLDPPAKKTAEGIPDAVELQNLLGKTGVTISPLRPVGMTDFNGNRLECIAESGYVERDKSVKVIKVEGTQLTVREVDKA